MKSKSNVVRQHRPTIDVSLSGDEHSLLCLLLEEDIKRGAKTIATKFGWGLKIPKGRRGERALMTGGWPDQWIPLKTVTSPAVLRKLRRAWREQQRLLRDLEREQEQAGTGGAMSTSESTGAKSAEFRSWWEENVGPDEE